MSFPQACFRSSDYNPIQSARWHSSLLLEDILKVYQKLVHCILLLKKFAFLLQIDGGTIVAGMCEIFCTSGKLKRKREKQKNLLYVPSASSKVVVLVVAVLLSGI